MDELLCRKTSPITTSRTRPPIRNLYPGRQNNRHQKKQTWTKGKNLAKRCSDLTVFSSAQRCSFLVGFPTSFGTKDSAKTPRPPLPHPPHKVGYSRLAKQMVWSTEREARMLEMSVSKPCMQRRSLPRVSTQLHPPAATSGEIWSQTLAWLSHQTKPPILHHRSVMISPT